MKNDASNWVMSGVAIATLTVTGAAADDGLDKRALDAMTGLARDGVVVGAYDPHGMLDKTSGLTAEHVYLPWRDVDLASLSQAAKYARERDRSLVVTVEPWTWSFRRKAEGAELHKTIVSGQSDAWITSVCKTFASLPNTVMVRFGQEMDLKNDRYPWSNWKPEEFVAAYRHFVDTCRSQAPTAKFMWSPRGEASAAAYFPGKSHVDAIGVSVFSYQKYDEGEFGRWRKPSEIITAASKDLTPFEIDIWAAEFGCDGDEKYRAECYRDLLKLKQTYPKLKGVLLFNELEPHDWPKGYGRPDWRIGPARVN